MNPIISRLPAIQHAFDQARQQTFFQHKAIDTLERGVITALAATEHDYAQHMATLKDALKDAEHAKTQAEAQRQRLITQSRRDRKMAVARGHRFKAKYQALLAAIDTVLPGAQALLTTRCLPDAEKKRRLAQLTEAIRQQKALCRSKVRYDEQRYRDVYGPGYGKACRLLDSLIARKQRLEHKTTY